MNVELPLSVEMLSSPDVQVSDEFVGGNLTAVDLTGAEPDPSARRIVHVPERQVRWQFRRTRITNCFRPVVSKSDQSIGDSAGADPDTQPDPSAVRGAVGPASVAVCVSCGQLRGGTGSGRVGRRRCQGGADRSHRRFHRAVRQRPPLPAPRRASGCNRGVPRIVGGAG